jgi:hypothetical protein
MITRARRWGWRTGAVTLGLAALALLLMGPYRHFLVASAAGSSAEDRPAPVPPRPNPAAAGQSTCLAGRGGAYAV